MDVLVDLTIAFLKVQLDAGVDAIQVFDSLGGTLSFADYRTFVLPHSTRVFAEIADRGVPMTHFGVGTAELLGAMAEATGRGPGTVVGVDWRTSLADAGAQVGPWYGLAGTISIQSSCWPDGRWPRGRRGPSTTDVGRWTRGGRSCLQPGSRCAPATDPGLLTDLVELVHPCEWLILCCRRRHFRVSLPPIDCAWRSVLARPSLCSTQASSRRDTSHRDSVRAADRRRGGIRSGGPKCPHCWRNSDWPVGRSARQESADDLPPWPSASDSVGDRQRHSHVRRVDGGGRRCDAGPDRVGAGPAHAMGSGFGSRGRRGGRRPLGEQVVESSVDPMLAGVYAGSADHRHSVGSADSGRAARRGPELTAATRQALPPSTGAPIFGAIGRRLPGPARRVGASQRTAVACRPRSH